MMKFLIPFLVVLGVSLPASAQNVCGKCTDILDQLFDRYTEAPAAMGLSSNGGMIEVLTSPKGNSWTIIVTMPNGVSCLVAAGEDWESVRPSAVGHGI